jgi:hypothetical protein
MLRLCPHCRRPMAFERCGIPLTPLKAAIFDAIKAAGDLGITSTEIIGGELYRDRRAASHHTIKSHVWQINELLEETNWIIRSEGDYRERRWCLRRRKVRKIA